MHNIYTAVYLLCIGVWLIVSVLVRTDTQHKTPCTDKHPNYKFFNNSDGVVCVCKEDLEER